MKNTLLSFPALLGFALLPAYALNFVSWGEVRPYAYHAMSKIDVYSTIA